MAGIVPKLSLDLCSNNNLVSVEEVLLVLALLMHEEMS